MEPNLTDLVRGSYGFKGVLSYDDGTLTYRYTKSRFLGMGSDQYEWAIDVADVRGISFKRFGSGSRLIVSPKRLHKFEGLPGDHGASVRFKVNASDREEAKALAAAIRRDLSDNFDMEYDGVPFRLPDVGFQELRGVMYLEPELLVLDIGVDLMIGGRVDSHVIKLDADAIRSVTVRRGVIWDRIALRLADTSQVRDLEFIDHDRIRLRIARRHRKEADAILRVVEMRRDLP